jgi:Fe2+ transport system protein FeoA
MGKEWIEVCPLCGFEFEKDETVCVSGCGMRSHCGLIRCPNCRYEFAEVPGFFPWLRRWRRRRMRQQSRLPGSIVPLSELEEGEEADFVQLRCRSASRRNALTVFGLSSGSTVILRQRRPVFLIQAGETTLAIEREIADEIMVKRRANDPVDSTPSPPTS